MTLELGFCLDLFYTTEVSTEHGISVHIFFNLTAHDDDDDKMSDVAGCWTMVYILYGYSQKEH